MQGNRGHRGHGEAQLSSVQQDGDQAWRQEAGAGLCQQGHVHSIESLCFHLWDNPDSCPTSPRSQVFFAVIFSFDEKVMIFFHQCRETRAVTSGGFEFLDRSSPTLTSGFLLGNGVCLGWGIGGGLMLSDSLCQQACDRKAPAGPPGAGHPREKGPERSSEPGHAQSQACK